MPNGDRLSDSAERLQMALRAARMVAWELDVATGKIECSAGTDDLTRSYLNDQFASELVQHALRGENRYKSQFRVTLPDGGVRWIQNQGEVGRDTNGRPSRVTGIALDITERKEAEDLLRSIAAGVSVATGDAFFRLLTQHLCLSLKTDFACVGELLDRNPPVVRTIAMFAGDAFSEGLEYDLAGTPCQEAIRTGRCFYSQGVQAAFPLDSLLVDAGIQSYLGVSLTDETGQPVGVMSVMSRSPLRNISSAETVLNIFAARASAELERRRWERALRESEIRNRAILNAIPDIMFILDGSGVIRNCYAKDSRELGVTPASISGKKLADVLGPEAARLILQSSTALKPGDPAVVEYSIPVEGHLHYYEARTVSLKDSRLLTIVRNTTDRKRAEANLEESQRFAHRVAETTPNVLFVYDLIERRNIYSNERSIKVLGYTPKEIEDMGSDFIPTLLHPDDMALLPELAKEYETRKDGEVFAHVLRMKHKNGQWRWVQRTATIFNRTPDGRPKQILGSVTDITRLKQNEIELQELSSRLLDIQDEERRRIARELHDVTGQNLTALGLNLAAIETFAGIDPNLSNTLAECQKLCRDSQEEIRTMSYLLHPPMLDRFGLVGALDWYVDGFMKRTGINVVLDVQLGTRRFPSEVETDLFRVIQEGLTNIMRHSGSKTASIRLTNDETHLILQIEDSGKGLTSNGDRAGLERKNGLGVGIPGMRERLRQHGGGLLVRSGDSGTTLTAILPLSFPGLSAKVLERRAGEL